MRVKTMSLSRGSWRLTLRRLCSRAPRITSVSATVRGYRPQPAEHVFGRGSRDRPSVPFVAMRRAVAVAGIAMAASGLLVGLRAARVHPDPSLQQTYVSTFTHVTHPLDVMLATGDGQAYAAIARDPTLARSAVFYASN